MRVVIVAQWLRRQKLTQTLVNLITFSWPKCYNERQTNSFALGQRRH